MRMRMRMTDSTLVHACLAAVKLQSWAIKATDTDGRAPRRVKFFVNRPSLGFSDAADFPAVQEFTLEGSDLEGKALPLKCAACASLHGATGAQPAPWQPPLTHPRARGMLHLLSWRLHGKCM